jgi:hypothetical protein
MQIFPRQLNLLPLVLGVVVHAALIGLVFVVWFYFAPHNLQVGYAPEQPIPYSHELHVSQLGLDCRYCHANVESSAEAMIPPTQTCMGCHASVRGITEDAETGEVHMRSAKLEPLLESWRSGDSVEWVRVHQLPDHAYFDHSVHLTAGVGCVSCHGRVDQMEVVRIEEPISMGWCLDCHRDPGPNLRPKNEITNMEWEPDEEWTKAGLDQALAAVNPPEHCSGCHR